MDAKARAETNSIKIQSGQMSPNEARAYDEQSPYKGGDEFWMMSNVAKVNSPTPTPPPAPPLRSTDGEGSEDEVEVTGGNNDTAN